MIDGCRVTPELRRTHAIDTRSVGARPHRCHRGERHRGEAMSVSQAPVALITGGSRGIGLAIAGRFLSDGYRVLITGRDRESLEAAASQLGAGAAIEAGDVAIRADVERIVAAAAAHYGHVDVLVNNAGILETVCLGTPLAEAEAIFDRVVDVSLKGAF